MNDAIRAKQVRLIDENGGQVGIVSIEDARARSEAVGLDLIEVAPEAKPPVCKIVDYGKLRYRESKKAAKARKASHQVIVKEVRVRPKTEEHDFQVKLRNALRFLEHGDKVQFTCMFRGREMVHQEVGMRHMQRLVKLLTAVTEENPEPIAIVEQHPRRTGNRIFMVLAPRKSVKQK